MKSLPKQTRYIKNLIFRRTQCDRIRLRFVKYQSILKERVTVSNMDQNFPSKTTYFKHISQFLRQWYIYSIYFFKKSKNTLKNIFTIFISPINFHINCRCEELFKLNQSRPSISLKQK